jgi:hypothetical protein
MFFMDKWLFDDPPDVAAITTIQVLEGATILYVSHDAEDGGWQFHTGKDIGPNDARVVALKRIVEIDSSIVELADLPLDWVATRSNADDVWQKYQDSENA